MSSCLLHNNYISPVILGIPGVKHVCVGNCWCKNYENEMDTLLLKECISCSGNVMVCAEQTHYSDNTRSAMASQITSVSIVCSTVCSVADKSSSSLAFGRGISFLPCYHHWIFMKLTLDIYLIKCLRHAYSLIRNSKVKPHESFEIFVVS